LIKIVKVSRAASIFNKHLTNQILPLQTSEMGKKRVLVGYGVDIDAVAGWLGSYGGEDSTSDISRGELFEIISI